MGPAGSNYSSYSVKRSDFCWDFEEMLYFRQTERKLNLRQMAKNKKEREREEGVTFSKSNIIRII